MPHKTIKMNLRCLLTDEEKLSLGNELADATNDLREIENDKSRVTSDFKARATAVEATISIASNKLRSGYEHRDVECKVQFDDPKPGKKTIYRQDIADIGDGLTIVEERDMTDEEIALSNQMSLPMAEEK